MAFFDVVDPKNKNTLGDFWVNTQFGQDNQTYWDYLILNGVGMPGLWAIELDLMHEHFPNKIPLNFSGDPNKDAFNIVTVDKGYNPASITAIGRIWTVEDWLQLKKMLPDINPKKNNATRTAFDISHPATSLMGIASVLVDRVRIMPPVDQTLFVTIGMTQFYAAAQKTGVHAGGGGVPKPTPPNPNASQNLPPA